MRFPVLTTSVLLAAFLAVTAFAEVPGLSPSDYTQVKESGKPFIINFYTETCVHCQRFKPEFEQAAKTLDGVLPIYATQDDNIIGPEGVQGVPTLKFYADGKSEIYNGQPAADQIVDFVLAQLKATVRRRQGKPVGSTKSAKSPGKASDGKKASSKPGGVITLTEASFSELLSDTENAWFVKFYAPWCGHCKTLAPSWEQLASELQGKVKVAEVDATVETSLASKLSIRGYPTILMFPPGKKSLTKSQQYQGPRELKDMMQFAMKAAAVSIRPKQLLDQSQLDAECSTTTCMIAFLPHILDSSAAERKKYIKIVTEVMTEEAGLPVRYFWMEGSNNLDFERDLRLEFGWPAVVAISRTKNVYAVHRGGFNTKAISDFLRGMTSGRTISDPLPKTLSSLKKMSKWDGKDAVREDL